MRHVHYTTLDYCCNQCGSSSDLAIEVESPSDYYLLDTDCPHCGAALPDNINDDAYKAVTNYFAGRADYLQDR
jgi:predicted nucleic acid-binding Zn ribbon protein